MQNNNVKLTNSRPVYGNREYIIICPERCPCDQLLESFTTIGKLNELKYDK